jgi:hypothetical protein
MSFGSVLSGPQVLSVTVNAHSFDIRLSGQRIVERVPFRRLSNGIALESFGGPTTFSDIRLTGATRS